MTRWTKNWLFYTCYLTQCSHFFVIKVKLWLAKFTEPSILCKFVDKMYLYDKH